MMLDLSLLVASLVCIHSAGLPVVVLVPTLGFVLVRRLARCSLDFSCITVGSVFMGTYIAVVGFPSLLKATSLPVDVQLRFVLAMQIPLVAFPLGMWLAAQMGGSRCAGLRRFARSRLRAVPRLEDHAGLFYIAIAVCAVTALVYAQWLTYVPLRAVFVAAPGDPVEKDLQRLSTIHVPGGLELAYEVCRRLVIPITVLYALFMAHVSHKWRGRFWFVLASGMLVGLLTLDRSVPFLTLAMLGLGWVAVRGALTAGAALRVGLAVLLACVLAAWISNYQYQKTPISFEQLVYLTGYIVEGRILDSPVAMAARAFATYPGEHPFLHGEYSRLLSAIRGGDVLTLDALATGDYPPDAISPVTFVGDLWRNWGWTGVVMGAVLYGFVFGRAELALCGCGDKTPARLTIHICLCASSLWLVIGGAMGVATTATLLGVLALSWIVARNEGRYAGWTSRRVRSACLAVRPPDGPPATRSMKS